VGQRGFWDEQNRVGKLQQKKPVLMRLSKTIPWDSFRPLLEKATRKSERATRGASGLIR
jgi:transposase, IS5 family